MGNFSSSSVVSQYIITQILKTLIQLAIHNRVQLIWVPGHEGIVANEMADQLARMGSEHPFTGPEPSCGISVGIAKKAVRDWLNRNHKNKGNPQLDSNRQRDLY
jgi:ribonuclease HI